MYKGKKNKSNINIHHNELRMMSFVYYMNRKDKKNIRLVHTAHMQSQTLFFCFAKIYYVVHPSSYIE